MPSLYKSRTRHTFYQSSLAAKQHCAAWGEGKREGGGALSQSGDKAAQHSDEERGPKLVKQLSEEHTYAVLVLSLSLSASLPYPYMYYASRLLLSMYYAYVSFLSPTRPFMAGGAHSAAALFCAPLPPHPSRSSASTARPRVATGTSP